MKRLRRNQEAKWNHDHFKLTISPSVGRLERQLNVHSVECPEECHAHSDVQWNTFEINILYYCETCIDIQYKKVNFFFKRLTRIQFYMVNNMIRTTRIPPTTVLAPSYYNVPYIFNRRLNFRMTIIYDSSYLTYSMFTSYELKFIGSKNISNCEWKTRCSIVFNDALLKTSLIQWMSWHSSRHLSMYNNNKIDVNDVLLLNVRYNLILWLCCRMCVHLWEQLPTCWVTEM